MRRYTIFYAIIILLIIIWATDIRHKYISYMNEY